MLIIKNVDGAKKHGRKRKEKTQERKKKYIFLSYRKKNKYLDKEKTCHF